MDISASRGVLTLMAANWPLMSVNVFFVGYGAPCPLMVQTQRAVEIVVNGVLRTLWVSVAQLCTLDFQRECRE